LHPLLSIIIPAYNEEYRLSNSLANIISFLERQSFRSEIVVVENGSTDRTAEVAQEFTRRYDNIHLLREPIAGKGRAVRSGMLGASGEYRFICDADLSMPIQEVLKFLPPQATDYDIAIASREVPGAVRYDEPTYRHWIGRAFNLLVQVIALPGIQDTQCGFKCFRAASVLELFPLQTIDGWTFDVEILFIARKRNLNILEVPISWYYHPGSRVNILRDSLVMFSDLFRIRWNSLKGRYDRSEKI
jgi:glycosyltransferase involved in cell wall biosynthesis